MEEGEEGRSRAGRRGAGGFWFKEEPRRALQQIPDTLERGDGVSQAGVGGEWSRELERRGSAGWTRWPARLGLREGRPERERVREAKGWVRWCGAT